jgi:CcmD family protein
MKSCVRVSKRRAAILGRIIGKSQMLHTPDATYLIIAYAVIWIGFFAYLGWIALRLRGLRTELETVRELVDERERDGAVSGGPGDLP